MAVTVPFSLVSPERSLAAFEVSEVQIPGSDGDMTAMPDHAPVITTLRPGILCAVEEKSRHEFVVTGGFAEIAPGSINVLAEMAVARNDMSQDILDEMLDNAKRALDSATSERVDEAQKTLAEIASIGKELGLSVQTNA